jgi:hypothetical protein
MVAPFGCGGTVLQLFDFSNDSTACKERRPAAREAAKAGGPPTVVALELRAADGFNSVVVLLASDAELLLKESGDRMGGSADFRTQRRPAAA